MQKIKRLTALPESNTSQILTPKSSFINEKQITRELLQHKTHRSNDLKWLLAPYLKEMIPTASSSDPCRNDLDRWWESRHLLISSVDLLKKWYFACIHLKYYYFIILGFLLYFINFYYYFFIFYFLFFNSFSKWILELSLWKNHLGPRT